MTQQRSLPVCQDGCPSAPSLADTRISNREDLSMKRVEPPAVEPFLKSPHRHPQLGQLPPPDNAVLSLGQPRNFPSQSGVSELSHDMSWLSSDTPWVLPLG